MAEIMRVARPWRIAGLLIGLVMKASVRASWSGSRRR